MLFFIVYNSSEVILFMENKSELNKDELMKIVGKRVKKLREGRGWYQKELARRLDIYVNVISDIEKGKRLPTQIMLYQMSYIFNVSIDYLFGSEERLLTEFEKEAIRFSKMMKNNGYSIDDVKRIMNIIIEVNKK